MEKLFSFDKESVTRLRNCTMRARSTDHNDPCLSRKKGWYKSEKDPNDMLDCFPALRLKKGYILRAYQFSDGRGNGNGYIWAMPLAAPFPDYKDCPRLESNFLKPPQPPGALDSVMEVIEGDGSPISYLCASIFAREVKEFGAIWHGCSWGLVKIIESDPWSNEEKYFGTPSPKNKWKWSLPRPINWRPHVKVESELINVTFYSYSGYFVQSISVTTDTYEKNSYCFKSESETVATGPSGYTL
jgi:hypothetical protein